MKETATVLWNRPGEFYFYLLSQLHLLHSSLCTVPVLEPLGNSASCTRICNPMASTTQCRNISRGTREKVKEEKEEALGRPSNCLMKTSNADWLKTISTGGSGGIGCATSAWCFYVSPASRYPRWWIVLDHLYLRHQLSPAVSVLSSLAIDPALTSVMQMLWFFCQPPLDVYNAQFEIVLAHYGWSTWTKFSFLVFLSRGPTLWTTGGNDDVHHTLTNALQLWFGDQHLQAVYQSQLRCHHQDSSKTLQELATIAGRGKIGHAPLALKHCRSSSPKLLKWKPRNKRSKVPARYWRLPDLCPATWILHSLHWRVMFS